MNLTKYVAAAAAALALGVSASSAGASIIDWTLSNLVFDDGGVATGTFSTDSTTGDVTAFDIVTTAGTTLPAFTYDSSTSFLFANNAFGPNSFILANADLTRYINLEFVNALTSTGVDQLILGQPYGAPGYLMAGSWDCDNCNSVRGAISGEAISGTPEPGAWALMLVGFGGLGVMLRASRSRASAAIA
jgi:hypothetical protein